MQIGYQYILPVLMLTLFKKNRNNYSLYSNNNNRRDYGQGHNAHVNDLKLKTCENNI